MTKRPLGIVLAMTAMIAAGCAQPPDPLSHLLVHPDTATELGYNIQWQRGLGLSGGDHLMYTELMDDRLATFESDNILRLVDVQDGEIQWTAQIGQPIEQFSRPLRDGDRVVICSGSRAFIYGVPRGQRQKVFDLKYVSNTTPLIHDGLLIHGAPTGHIFAHYLDRGLLSWAHQADSAITTNPVMAGSSLVLGTSNGQVVAINPSNGRRLWSRSTYATIGAQPAADDRLVYVPSEDQSLYAFFHNSGRQSWRYYAEVPLTRSPSVLAGLVLLPEPGNQLTALDPDEDGSVVWTRPDLANAEPLMAGEAGIYLHRKNERTIAVVSPENGKTVKEVPIPDVHHVLPDGSNPPSLYAIRVDGRLMKLAPR